MKKHLNNIIYINIIYLNNIIYILKRIGGDLPVVQRCTYDFTNLVVELLPKDPKLCSDCR